MPGDKIIVDSLPMMSTEDMRKAKKKKEEDSKANISSLSAIEASVNKKK